MSHTRDQARYILTTRRMRAATTRRMRAPAGAAAAGRLRPGAAAAGAGRPMGGLYVTYKHGQAARAARARPASWCSWCAAGAQLVQKPPIWGTHNTQLPKECDGHGRFFHYPSTTQACARRRPGRGRGRPWAVFGWYGRFFSAHFSCTPATVSRVRPSKKVVLQTEKYPPKTAHQLPIPSPPGHAREPPSCTTRRPAARPGAAAAAPALDRASNNLLHLSPRGHGRTTRST